MAIFLIKDIEGTPLARFDSSRSEDKRILKKIFCLKEIEDFNPGDEEVGGFQGEPCLIKRDL